MSVHFIKPITQKMPYVTMNRGVSGKFSTTIEIVESNINVKLDHSNSTHLKDPKILVLSLVNNCKFSYPYIENFVNNLQSLYSNVYFSFFSNNNIDNTFSLLKILATQYRHIQIIEYPNEIINKDNRINKFANYRNINFEIAISTFGRNFDYLIVFDSDLRNNIPIEPIAENLLVTDPIWSCISGNHCYKNSFYYYDDLALRFINDDLDITKKYKLFHQYYGNSEKWIEQLNIMNGWIKVRCAFGGISIYKMQEILDIYDRDKKLYDVSNLPPFTAEHISLNLKLPNCTLINSNLKYNNAINIEGSMYNNPIAFVPRDAGFFSVFNFYIGSLVDGMRSYPLWNKEELLRMHNTNEHFAYWTDSYNCWFDYFEPVSFFDNDITHHTMDYIKLPRYSGEHGPEELRIPSKTKQLLKSNSDDFKAWRKKLHHFYRKFIHLKPEILNHIDTLWNSYFNPADEVIGVHYRHPSHFVESGKIYLEDYFNKIDEIILANPSCKIFIASDSSFGIYAFLEKYPNKISFIKDIDRISMCEFLHWSFGLVEGKADTVGFINGKGYELHHKRVSRSDNKKMTIDLLTEVMCLSKCNHLVSTVSNIPLAISYINPNINIYTL